jgi:hypothetical protein
MIFFGFSVQNISYYYYFQIYSIQYKFVIVNNWNKYIILNDVDDYKLDIYFYKYFNFFIIFYLVKNKIFIFNIFLIRINVKSLIVYLVIKYIISISSLLEYIINDYKFLFIEINLNY